ncbi:unnamed protein product [Linum trigynum]|uniref:Uncharacterized protein n=1 Tax=Linum trigynum TaxID=586398 RepID=A0AAV2C6C0_9ROSI
MSSSKLSNLSWAELRDRARRIGRRWSSEELSTGNATTAEEQPDVEEGAEEKAASDLPPLKEMARDPSVQAKRELPPMIEEAARGVTKEEPLTDSESVALPSAIQERVTPGASTASSATAAIVQVTPPMAAVDEVGIVATIPTSFVTPKPQSTLTSKNHMANQGMSWRERAPLGKFRKKRESDKEERDTGQTHQDVRGRWLHGGIKKRDGEEAPTGDWGVSPEMRSAIPPSSSTHLLELSRSMIEASNLIFRRLKRRLSSGLRIEPPKKRITRESPFSAVSLTARSGWRTEGMDSRDVEEKEEGALKETQDDAGLEINAEASTREEASSKSGWVPSRRMEELSPKIKAGLVLMKKKGGSHFPSLSEPKVDDVMGSGRRDAGSRRSTSKISSTVNRAKRAWSEHGVGLCRRAVCLSRRSREGPSPEKKTSTAALGSPPIRLVVRPWQEEGVVRRSAGGYRRAGVGLGPGRLEKSSPPEMVALERETEKEGGGSFLLANPRSSRGAQQQQPFRLGRADVDASLEGPRIMGHGVERKKIINLDSGMGFEKGFDGLVLGQKSQHSRPRIKQGLGSHGPILGPYMSSLTWALLYGVGLESLGDEDQKIGTQLIPAWAGKEFSNKPSNEGSQVCQGEEVQYLHGGFEPVMDHHEPPSYDAREFEEWPSGLAKKSFGKGDEPREAEGVPLKERLTALEQPVRASRKGQCEYSYQIGRKEKDKARIAREKRGSGSS